MNGMSRNKRENKFLKSVEEICSNHSRNFSEFIVKEMGIDSEYCGEEQRRLAFRIFRKRTTHYKFASLPTMRRWFGIGGAAKPSRIQLYGICLELKTGRKKAEEYFLYGLQDSNFVYQDYQEYIFVYGLEHGHSYEQCLAWIEDVEKEWSESPSFKETNCPKESVYEEWISKDANEFLSWVKENQRAFPGYNPQVLECIHECKTQVINSIRGEAKERLESLLAETDYKKWRSEKKYQNLGQREIINRYLKSRQNGKFYKISHNIKSNITELSKIVYSDLEANSRLLAEVYSNKTQCRIVFGDTELFLPYMSSKRLSDLFNIPLQRRREIQARQACRILNQLNQEEKCPDWIQMLQSDFLRTQTNFSNVKDTLEWLKKYIAEHHRRCLHIERGDILPLVHYIAQHSYLEKQTTYDAKQARKEFCKLANKTLSICQLAPLNEKFQLDAILLECFQKEEMFSYSEAIELLADVE